MSPVPDNITWRRYRHRFRVPLRTGAGLFHEREGIIVRVAFPGIPGTGLGEIAPWPGFGCETVEAAETFLCTYRGGPVPPEFPCVRAAIEMAWNALTLSTPPFPPAPLRSAALLTESEFTVNEFSSKSPTRQRRAAGFTTFKLKITGEPDSPSLEIARILLESLLPAERLRLDANGSLPSHTPWLPLLEDPRLEFIEQPFSPARMNAEHTFFSALPSALSCKFALDESVSCAALLPEDWPGFIVLKTAFLTDWDVFRQWRRRHPESPVIYSSAFETPVGRDALLRLAAEDPLAPAFAHGLDTLSVFEPDAFDDSGGPDITES